MMAVIKAKEEIKEEKDKDSKEEAKKEIVPPEPPKEPEALPLDRVCSFCDYEALFMGEFKSEWFSLPVLMCKDCLAGLINKDVALEELKAKYDLPDEFPKNKSEVVTDA